MSDNNSTPTERTVDSSRTTRRRFVRLAGATGVTAGLAGCSGGGSSAGDGGGSGGSDGSGSSDDSGGSSGSDGESSGSSGGGGSVTIEWMTWPHGPMEELNAVLHEAGMSKDITVKRVPGGDNTDDFKSRTQQTLSASRARPDVFHMDSAWILPFVQRGQLVNLTEQFSSDVLSTVEENYSPSIQVALGKENLSSDGDLYAAPSLADFPSILYRKDLVTEAGFDPDGESWATEPMTWKEFSNVVAEVQSSAGTKYGFISNWAQSTLIACCSFNEIMIGFGGSYFGGMDNVLGNVGDRPITVAEQPTIDALRMLRTFMYGYEDDHSLPEDSGYAGGISTPSTLQWQLEPERKQFHAGNAAFMRTWPYSYPIEFDKWGEDLGLMPVPYGVPAGDAKYGRSTTGSNALGGWNNAVNPNSEYVEESVAFLEAMTKPEVQLHLLEAAGKLPPNANARQTALEQPDRFPAMGPFMDTIQTAAKNAVPYPVSTIWSQEASKVTQQVFGTLNQNSAPQSAMDELATQLEQLEGTV